MHFVEVRRWQDIRKKDSVNSDPFNPNLSVPNPETGYPGGTFDPLGFRCGPWQQQQQPLWHGLGRAGGWAGLGVGADRREAPSTPGLQVRMSDSACSSGSGSVCVWAGGVDRREAPLTPGLQMRALEAAAAAPAPVAWFG
jgi:hypothetical protein